MLTWAAVLFALAALGGVVMVAIRARGGMPPLGLAFIHGAAAATGLGLLALGVFGEAEAAGLLQVSLALFALAAVGGFVLLSTHLRKGSFPLGFALAHGGTAVLAFILLLAGLLA